MVIRTFFDRNNTIIYNDLTNTGRNPVAELFYGGAVGDEIYSRFLFHFDEERLKEVHACGGFGDLSKVKHTLRMTNTGAFDLDLLNKTTCGGKARSCSFDLNVFKINQEWDEGNGYDYGSCGFLSTGNGAVIATCPSNWTEAQTATPWSGGNGTYTGSSSGVTIATQHFEQGNENLEIDVTDYVNGILTGDTNYGLGLAYPSLLEATPTLELQYVGFFTRHTQTFYEPFLETIYNCPIEDDRADFHLDKLNKIYLYSNVGGVPTTLDNLPTVTIVDPFDNGFSSFTATQIACGVYCAEFIIPSSSAYTDCLTFEDVWSDININGISRPDIELEFVVKDSGYYNIGDNSELPKEYGFTVSGIKSDERIKRGDIRRVNVSARIPYTVNQTQVIDNLEYRLYVKEGRNEYTVIDFQPVNRAYNGNYFLLDTASLIPNTYYLDVKVTSNYEVRTVCDVLKFEIVSQVELRDSQ
jgi:hypothetical protein